MAITFIYSIAKTGEKSLKYDTENKDGKIISKEKNDSSDSLNYVMEDKKGNIYRLSQEYLDMMKNYISHDENGNMIFHTVTSSLNCSVGNTYENWQEVRNRSANGNSGNLQYCIVQNFGTAINPRLANKIGVEFAKKYLSDYQVIVSTHINTGLVHNHIEFNATSFKTLKKFNDNISAIADIRKISDELCKKYDLPVLEKTANFNYVLYKDANGKTKIFEPTERKEAANKKRSSDANSYLNSKEYDDYINNENVHSDILKCDIDKLVNEVDSYENLLEALRDIGYVIKDKTQKGEWRKHISFKLENWGKPIRDSALAEKYGEEYLRENITEHINNKNKKDDKIEIEKNIEKTNASVFNNFQQYSEKKKKKKKSSEDEYYDFENMDEEYKYSDEEFFSTKQKRPDIEKYIIRDAKKMSREINNISKNVIDDIGKEAAFRRMTRDEYLDDCIMKDMLSLRFIEKRKLGSFTDINTRMRSLYEKRNECYNTIQLIQNNLIRANEVKVAIENFQKLKYDMEVNSTNPNYALYEKENDIALLQSYEKYLKEHDLNLPEKQEKWLMKYEEHKTKLVNLTEVLDSINKRLESYDDCVNNIKRINHDYHVFDSGLHSYDELKNEFTIHNDYEYKENYENQIEKEKEEQEKNNINIYE